MASNKWKVWLKQNLIPVLIILSAILGIIFGFIVKNIWPDISPESLQYIGLPGVLVIRAFTVILVPLIISSLANSIASTKSGENKRLISLTFILFILFSTYATIFGSILVSIIRPGVRSQEEMDLFLTNDSKSVQTLDVNRGQVMDSKDDAIYDLFMNMVPDNIVSVTIMQQYTGLVPINAQNSSFGYKKVVQSTFKTNYLGLCIISLILGFALLKLGDKVASIQKLIRETNEIIMEIVKALLMIMPIGMFSWMCVEAIKMKSPETVLTQLIWFFGTALLAFSMHFFVILSGIYFLIVRKNPYKFLINLFPALIVAFGSGSSAFTLPMTIKCMEDNNKVPKNVCRFVLPLGMTVHMNGIALYYTMLTLFVAQMHGLDVSFQQRIVLSLFVLLMSVAIPGVPAGGGSVVNFMAACASIGIDNPMDVLAYIMTVDWFMDRMRTIVTIIGDCFVTAIVHKIAIK